MRTLKSKTFSRSVRSGLPARLKPLFWEHDFRRLTWKRDRDLVIGRILANGDWDSVQWLHARLGDAALRAWLVGRQGAGLDPRRLRYWELMLEIPHGLVNQWLASENRRVWDRRRNR